MNALIVAAGLGTRLKPLTDHQPKALVPVNGVPMLEHQIRRLMTAGFDHIVVNVHHFGEQIIDFIKRNGSFGIRIDISDERSLLLDTGGAVRQAAHFFTDNEPVLVHNVDIFSNADLRAFYAQHKASGADASLLVSKRNTSRYLYFDDGNRLKGWKNITNGAVKSPFADVREALSSTSAVAGANALHPYAFAGIHILSPALFDDLDAYGEVFSIIDYYLAATERHDIRALPAADDFRLVDAGKPDTLPLAAAFV